MNLRAVVLALSTAFLIASSGAAQSAEDPAVRVTTDALELKLGGRIHTQFNTTSIAVEPTSELFVRRARVELSARLGDRVSGAIQPEFGNDRVTLKDAFVSFQLSPEVSLLAGKAYRPFGLLEQTSSKRILPVERGLRVRGLGAVDAYAVVSGLGYSNRDVGVQLRGILDDGLEVTAGAFQGPLHGQVGANSSYQYAARVRGAVAPDVRVAAGWSSRDFAEVVGAELVMERGQAFEIDVEYGSFAPGLHVLAEIVSGDANPFSEERFHGAQAWVAYRTEPFAGTDMMLEPLLRLSHADVGIDDVPATQRGGTLVTPGLALYFGPLNRIALNYDLWWGRESVEDANSFKVMFQMGF
ncbi:MAG: porin [Gemmatimonadota bacterium]